MDQPIRVLVIPPVFEGNAQQSRVITCNLPDAGTAQVCLHPSQISERSVRSTFRMAIPASESFRWDTAIDFETTRFQKDCKRSSNEVTVSGIIQNNDDAGYLKYSELLSYLAQVIRKRSEALHCDSLESQTAFRKKKMRDSCKKN